jgi:hypothetical protein
MLLTTECFVQARAVVVVSLGIFSAHEQEVWNVELDCCSQGVEDVLPLYMRMTCCRRMGFGGDIVPSCLYFQVFFEICGEDDSE